MNTSHIAIIQWEKPKPPETPSYEFPPPDLLNELVRLYFVHLDVCVSLLHRPTFERSIAAGLHHSDVGFAGVVLAVCSVASRYTGDERVLLEGYPSRHSSARVTLQATSYKLTGASGLKRR